MCSPATCRTCGKATYKGCGQHVEQVLRGVPRNQRCSCTPEQKAVGRKGFLARLLGR